ncbi:DUF6326 family protein [Nocardiopsis lambiniae]|uniref:DUF6326 family protein n=1 Tax=Nocardiopsis lambiniae TaxID=3075539 RepID=A0ABU2MDX4_9ACTN|nr:DUF6326 family protein [Nocardiopsis sp. DSM 44743]MDT0330872.1 DUF6326 family protein [Nocardiopsis sp. DSM 44743]
MTTTTNLEPSPVNVRIKISALWVTVLLLFAFVDIFGLYRPDVRAAIEAGEIGGFAVDQVFLFSAVAYVVVPSLMVFLVLVLRPRVNRIVNIVLGVVYALTIVAAALGEWGYYLFASALEIGLLAAIVYYAWTWPKEPARGSTPGRTEVP